MRDLRSYQERAISLLRDEYARGRRAPCLVLPTGAGKTVVASAIIRSAIAKQRRVLFLAHRVELIDQSVAKLEASGVANVRMIRADRDVGSADAPVTVASIPTLASASWADRLPAADLVVIDECHHAAAATWRRLGEAYRAARLLGMTATPQRGDGAALGDMFDSLVVGATVRELMELGHLVRCRVFAPNGILSSGKTALTPAAAYQLLANGQRAVVFCSTVEHATAVVAEMIAAGVPAAVVDGEMPVADRRDVLARFRAGELRAVANVHVLTEGWDDPGCAVCILARKPDHAGTYLQMVGRVLRPSPEKTQAIVIDLCGSSVMHGPPDLERHHSLDGEGISVSDREAIRQCPRCGGVFLSAAVDAGACPHCGEQLPKQARRAYSSTGQGVREVSAEDRLSENLQDAARRSGRDLSWVQRAHSTILCANLRWRP